MVLVPFRTIDDGRHDLSVRSPVLKRTVLVSFDVERQRDVIECPIDDDIDCSGWDLRRHLVAQEPTTRCSGTTLAGFPRFARRQRSLLTWYGTLRIVWEDAESGADRTLKTVRKTAREPGTRRPIVALSGTSWHKNRPLEMQWWGRSLRGTSWLDQV